MSELNIFDESIYIVGLRIKSTPAIAPAVKIIRKYASLSIGEIQNAVGTDKYIFSCQCHEERKLGQMIKLYKELDKIGAILEILDGGDPISFEILQNQYGSVRATRKSYGDIEDNEI